MPTHGSCLPFVDIDVFLPNLSIVFLLFKMEDVGLTAKETIISCPEEIPPSIPPALLELNFNFFFLQKFHLNFPHPIIELNSYPIQYLLL